jgi:hypothetical protein
MQFTGDDFFKDKNVCSIVIELPNSELGTNKVGIWARTVDKTAEDWIQADRGGRPLQAVFLVGEQRKAYLSGAPANDDRFVGVLAHELEHSGGLFTGGRKSHREKVIAGHSFLRPSSAGALSAQWPDAYRRCCRRFLFYVHEPKRDR